MESPLSFIPTNTRGRTPFLSFLSEPIIAFEDVVSKYLLPSLFISIYFPENPLGIIPLYFSSGFCLDLQLIENNNMSNTILKELLIKDTILGFALLNVYTVFHFFISLNLINLLIIIINFLLLVKSLCKKILSINMLHYPFVEFF